MNVLKTVEQDIMLMHFIYLLPMFYYVWSILAYHGRPQDFFQGWAN